VYFKAFIASSTRCKVSGFTVPSLLITRETVFIETPAISATLLMVAAKFDLTLKIGLIFNN
jgi:hypothetical protein